jgi:hypothetical protein
MAQSAKAKTGLVLLLPVALCLMPVFIESPYQLSPARSVESNHFGFSIADFRLSVI